MFNQWFIELEVPEGLEDISLREIKQNFASLKPENPRDGILTIEYDDDFKKLSRLQSVYACYVVLEFPIPRPKALLGHQYFTQIINVCQMVIADGQFNTVAINAAGSDSSVMQRILSEISTAVGLTPSSDEGGDLLIRIRKVKNMWQVLIRTTPRPLSTRKWRIHDYQGALNAPIAYAMNQLISKHHQSACVNFMCGSGALLIERDSPNLVLGVDNNPHALSISQDHIMLAKKRNIQLIQADVKQAPFDDNSLSAITSDMPFGQLVGSHDENRALYPPVLKEMHRTLAKEGIAVLITHEVRLLEKIIQSQNWRIVQSRKTNLRGIHPRIYVLEKQ